MQTRRREAGSRRAEATRLMIELGTLIAEAGLSRADRHFLRGLLREAASLTPGSAEHERLRAIGEALDGRSLA